MINALAYNAAVELVTAVKRFMVKVLDVIIKSLLKRDESRENFDPNFELDNCDICAEQNNLFMNEIKWYKIWPRLKG